MKTPNTKTNDNGAILYSARCNVCGEIDCCPNGAMVEAAALLHAEENPDHEIIVGFVVVCEEHDWTNRSLAACQGFIVE